MSKGPWSKGSPSAGKDSVVARLREAAAQERLLTNDRVIAALEKHGPLSIEQIVWKTELAKSVVQNAIDRLRRDGEIRKLSERRRVGRSGTPAHIYELGAEEAAKPEPMRTVVRRHEQDVALFGEYRRAA
jgi:predicted ArsR family transcriptional regulator